MMHYQKDLLNDYARRATKRRGKYKVAQKVVSFKIDERLLRVLEDAKVSPTVFCKQVLYDLAVSQAELQGVDLSIPHPRETADRDQQTGEPITFQELWLEGYDDETGLPIYRRDCPHPMAKAAAEALAKARAELHGAAEGDGGAA